MPVRRLLAGGPSWARKVLVLLWQGVKLQSAGERRRFAAISACRRALCTTCVRGARLAGQHGTVRALLGGAVVLECCILG
jgi:hypothetical protein